MVACNTSGLSKLKLGPMHCVVLCSDRIHLCYLVYSNDVAQNPRGFQCGNMSKRSSRNKNMCHVRAPSRLMEMESSVLGVMSRHILVECHRSLIRWGLWNTVSILGSEALDPS